MLKQLIGQLVQPTIMDIDLLVSKVLKVEVENVKQIENGYLVTTECGRSIELITEESLYSAKIINVFEN